MPVSRTLYETKYMRSISFRSSSDAALLAAEVTFTVTLARCSSPWFLVEKRDCLQSTTDHASNGPKIRRIECKICCNFLKQALTIERIPGDEMYTTLKEFGKRQKNLRASHLLLRSEWAWSERARQLSNRQKITLQGLAITFSYQTRGVVAMANGKFRMRSFMAQGSVAMREWKIRMRSGKCATGRFNIAQYTSMC